MAQFIRERLIFLSYLFFCSLSRLLGHIISESTYWTSPFFLFSFFQKKYVFIRVGVHLSWDTDVVEIRGQLTKSVVSHHAASEDQTPVVSFGSKCPYP